MSWINRVLTNEESPEAKLLRQRMKYFGMLLLFAAACGRMPVYEDWTMELNSAIFVAIIGFVLIVLDMVDTRTAVKMSGPNGPVGELVAGQLASIEWDTGDGTLATGSGQPHGVVPTADAAKG